MPDLPPAPKVLVIRLSSLGDVLLTTPVFENLRAAYPGARLSVLTKGAFAPVFHNNPHVDDVLRFEDRGLWGWSAEIRRRGFDLILDLHGMIRSRVWCLAGGTRFLRYDKRTVERRRLVRTKKLSPRLTSRVTDRYLETLDRLGIPAPRRVPRLYLGVEESLSPALAARLGPGPFIGIAPGAAHKTKQWPPERFAAAADGLLAGKTGTVLILGSAGDRAAADATARALKSPSVNLAGETSLREMFLALSLCQVVLTNDSGAMHAASALDVPVAALFGPTVESFGFFPGGPKAKVLQVEDLPCRPCHLHGGDQCPLGHHRCLLDIPASAVVRAASDLLS